MTWDKVAAATTSADSIAFDGCHKIYVLMDAGQTAQMRGYGYGDGDGSLLLTRADLPPDEEMFDILREWWTESCGLRFINAVKTVDGDPNKGFTDLIAQFEDEATNG